MSYRAKTLHGLPDFSSCLTLSLSTELFLRQLSVNLENYFNCETLNSKTSSPSSFPYFLTIKTRTLKKHPAHNDPFSVPLQ